MTRRMKLFAALALGLAAAGAGTAYAVALQGDSAAALRASLQVGEQADGYMGAVGSAPAELRAQMDAVNIQRRAAYTALAQRRGVTIEEAAAATACQLFAERVLPGQYYRLTDGVWRRRNGSEPVPLPPHCG